jgi:hypothetical protein
MYISFRKIEIHLYYSAKHKIFLLDDSPESFLEMEVTNTYPSPPTKYITRNFVTSVPEALKVPEALEGPSLNTPLSPSDTH